MLRRFVEELLLARFEYRNPTGRRLTLVVVVVIALVIAVGSLWTVPLCAAEGAGRPGKSNPERTLRFERDIRPIVQKHCFKCHSAKNRKAELNLQTLAGMLRGGESGNPAIVVGLSKQSRLIQLISAGEMPPGKTKLAPADIAKFREWIDTGAAGESLPGQEKPDSWAGEKLSPELQLARRVQFLFEVKCYQCHGRKQQKAGLDLRSMASILKGGKSGPALVRGNAEKSLIVRRIQADQMPPRNMRYLLSIKPVVDGELKRIVQWINDGAVSPPPRPGVVKDDGFLVSDRDREWWAFQSLGQPRLPTVRNRTRVRTPLDVFVLSKLESAGLNFSADADRATLIRRASLDLLGLPPCPSDIRQFLNDPHPDAYERLIDRLLASVHYGERWGQHWLDAAGYADSEGSTSTDLLYPNFYRYRDYVIRSLNTDKPYDRFLLEQLAGDELADSRNLPQMTPEIADNLIATGFLRTCIDPTTSQETNFLDNRYQVLADTVEIVSSSLMGLTMRCARCHSHKYDPLPQRDYYRLTAVFSAAYSPQNWIKPQERFLILAGTREQQEIRSHNATVESTLKRLQKDLNDLTASFTKKHFEQKLAKLPESVRASVRRAIQTPAEKRTETQKTLAAKYEKQLRVDLKELPAAFPAYQKAAESLSRSKKATQALRKELPKAHGLTDLEPDPLPFYLLKRGEWNKRGRQVLPNVPAVLTDENNPYQVRRPWKNAPTTGRRLAFARWLTHPNHPLTARVFVNRVWQHHFGNGIVSTADDFGQTGAQPTHPHLLDWLSRNFVRQGWSVKQLQRLMMTSTVFRQQSRVRGEASAVDPENKLLWRMPLRRVDAEVVRDSMLAISGRLSPSMFGPPSAIERTSDGQIGTKDSSEHRRRSIYMLHRRSAPLTVLETFDSPRMTTNCIQRRTSIVVSQALLMLNSAFTDTGSAQLAEQIVRQVGRRPSGQLELAYHMVLGRPPTESEQMLGLQFMRNQAIGYHSDRVGSGLAQKRDAQMTALADLCLVLFNSAEFLYVD